MVQNQLSIKDYVFGVNYPKLYPQSMKYIHLINLKTLV